MKQVLMAFVLAASAVPGQVPAPVPQQQGNLELTVYLLSGLAQGEAADDVPQDLVSTVKQLRSIFNYKSYKLSESFILRGRLGGGASAKGVLPGSAGLEYEFRYNTVTASSDTPPLFRINGLRIRLTKARRPLGVQTSVDTIASIDTDLDIREGQKSVVGKSSVSSSGDALILVIVPKLIQ